jgi:hypothetical protein
MSEPASAMLLPALTDLFLELYRFHSCLLYVDYKGLKPDGGFVGSILAALQVKPSIIPRLIDASAQQKYSLAMPAHRISFTIGAVTFNSTARIARAMHVLTSLGDEQPL